MKKRILDSAAILLLLTAPVSAGPKAAPKAKPAAATAAAAPESPQDRPWISPVQRNIRMGDITVTAKVTGLSTAQETYDIFAPFDGRIEEVQTELFSFVTPKTLIARMVSTEMAALLDSSSSENRKQTEARWKDLYSYTEIKPESQGIITNIYAEPKTPVNKGDRLFTVARKVVIIAKNTTPLYTRPAPGMTAELLDARDPDVAVKTSVTGVIRLKDSPLYNRLWLEVLDLKDGIKIGEQFDGTLLVGKGTDAMLVPRKHIIESGGRRFLVTEIKTGLETEDETEITGHSSIYLEPEYPEAKNGKDKTAR
jgi:hypothetical protein